MRNDLYAPRGWAALAVVAGFGLAKFTSRLENFGQPTIRIGKVRLWRFSQGLPVMRHDIGQLALGSQRET